MNMSQIEQTIKILTRPKSTAVGIILALTCSSQAFAGEPTKSDVNSYLRATLPVGTNVQSVVFKNFESTNEGVGRTAVEGKVALHEDYLVQQREYLSRFMRQYKFNNTAVCSDGFIP